MDRIHSKVFSVDGSDSGIDGCRIGLNGLPSVSSDDKESAMCRLLVEEGCRLKLTQNGDILIKRDDNINIFISKLKQLQSSLSDVVVKCPYGLLQQDKTYKLFDMNKFQNNLSQELLSEDTDWNKLEEKAVSVFSFARFTENILDAPVWVIVVNIVALHVVKTLKESLSLNH